MEKATTAEQSREILDDMLGRLGQSHFAIIPAAAYQEMKGAEGPGVTGLVVRLVDGLPVVVKVEKGMPSDKIGVQPGWQIVRIAGKDLAGVLAKIRAASKNARFLDEQLYHAIFSRLRGKVGEKLTVVFENGAGNEASLDIPLGVRAGSPARFG